MTLHENQQPLSAPQTMRERAVERIGQHSYGLLRQAVSDFYAVHNPASVFDDKLDSLVVAEPAIAKEQEDNLMIVQFTGDIHAQSQHREYYSPGFIATRKAILKAHKSQHISQPRRVFTGIGVESDRADNPYWRMRGLRRNRDGKPIRGGYGVNYAAKAALGHVVLANPDFSAEIQDEDTRGLIAAVFGLD